MPFFFSLSPLVALSNMHTTNSPQASHLHKQLYFGFFTFTYVAKQFDTLFSTMCGQEMVFTAFIKTYELVMKSINHLYMLDFVKETTFIGSGGSRLIVLRVKQFPNMCKNRMSKGECTFYL